jgi:3-hydroxymyristoyl/3-hydroxydecanoyl-(acyl carrier protein) dehydratase
VSSTHFWCTVLIVALSITLSPSLEAQSGGGKIVSNGTIVGVVVGVVAAVVVVAVVIVHKSGGKRAVKGCVGSGAGGMNVTNDKDKRVYALGGNTEAIKPGDRMGLQLKKVKQKEAGRSAFWEIAKVDKDFGVCQP